MSLKGKEIYDSDSSDAEFYSAETHGENLINNGRDFIEPNFDKKSNIVGNCVQSDSDDDHSSIPKHEDKDIEKNDITSIFYVDIDYLKDLDKNLSQEEKEENHQKAIELKESGNEFYKNSSFESASLDYTNGLRKCPLSFAKTRSILYANRAAARSQLSDLDLKACKLDCTQSIELNPSYLKAILRRANYSKQLDQLDEALSDYQKVLEIDPSNREAKEATMVLPGLINERNEKLKEEMMGKLKDLGNMVLKPFGLSTNNFSLQQNPNSGGYNIQFNQS